MYGILLEKCFKPVIIKQFQVNFLAETFLLLTNGGYLIRNYWLSLTEKDKAVTNITAEAAGVGQSSLEGQCCEKVKKNEGWFQRYKCFAIAVHHTEPAANTRGQ